TVVTGTLYAARLQRLLATLPAATARVIAVPNAHFGGTISVAGLLTGGASERRLAVERDLGEVVLVPAVAVRDGEGVFLDDRTPADLERALGVPVQVIE